MFSCPQRVFSLCERADLLGSPGWDLDHIDVEVYTTVLSGMEVWVHGCTGVWVYRSMGNGCMGCEECVYRVYGA